MIAELDRLSEKVELARETIVKLRSDNDRLTSECESLRQELARFRAVGETPEKLEALFEGVDSASQERDELRRERDEVVKRIHGILEKVEALEDVS